MPMIKIELLEGRNDKMLQNLIIEVTDATAQTLQINKENIQVIIREEKETHWGQGGKLLRDKKW